MNYFRLMLQKQLQLSNRQTKIVCRNFLFASKRNPKTARSGLWKRVRGQIRNCFHPNANNLSPMEFSFGKQISTAELVKTMLQSVWPRGNWKIRRLYIYSMVLLIVAKMLNVYVPFLLKNIINYYNESVPTDLQLSTNSYSSMLGIAAFSIIVTYGAARSGSSLFNELRNAVFARVAQYSIRSIAQQIFLHLHSLDLSFHLSHQTGGMSKAIDRGTRGMAFVQSALVFNVVPTVIEVGMVSGLLYINCGPSFTFATLGCLSTYTLATLGITKWRTKFRHQMNQADNDASNRAVDSLINYETVKYFNNERFEADRYDFFLKKYEIAALKASTSLAFLNFAQNAIFSGGLVAVMCLAAAEIQKGTMNVGDLILANTLLFQLSVPLNFLGSVYREIKQGLVDMQLMFSLLYLKSSIIEKPNAPLLKVDMGNSSISFRNVTFGYLPGQHILKGLNLDIPSGKKVAIVGGSGSGKSTIIRLLYRLFDPVDGEICINGQKICDVQLESLRKMISIVPQDSVLFHDTIYYNIQYGNPTAAEDEIFYVSRLANLHDSVIRFKNGYDTIVGERGLMLSGGEKQRVAIARALLKNAPIIVYDEATSSLDALTEENIMRSMRNAVQQRTSLFIAHRLATVIDADIIYVLENGKVIESGSHFKLLEKSDGYYSNLWKSQHKYSEVIPSKQSTSEYGPEHLHLGSFDNHRDNGCCRSGGGCKR